ncbi:hypothetical protein G7054_g14111 [Neopestalotiopsis clavispora]|nr:hypothetical protein G7054_g14111 [Neopestalotiopsis clavispora]
MADEMDHNSSSPPRASLAESSATSTSNAAALRFRETSRISSTQPASVHPPSTQQEPPRPTQSSRTPRESHEEQATMDTTDISIASSVTDQFNLDLAADYLGPVAYSTGETLLPLILLMITAIVCYFYGKILMSLASLITIASVQQYKLLDYQYLSYNQRRDQDRRGVGHGPTFYLPIFLYVMRFFNFFMCATMLFVLLGFGAASLSPTLTYLIFVPSFVLFQCIYWPLHGYNLHRNITQYRPDFVRSLPAARQHNWHYTHGDFFLIFAGSGGHTTEILSLMKQFEPFDETICRRYVITSGDERSEDMIKQFEEQRAQRMITAGKLPGIYQTVTVARARYVGQSWLTTPFTTIKCIQDCYRIINLQRPYSAPGAPIEYPQTILCNGPGSSSMFVLVSHLMRMYSMMPANRGITIFVESIARVKSLSLTGKIFYYLDLADAFVVQHRGVEDVYPDVVCEPMLVKRG